tara:strand:- start:13119 stop:13817 length:699 start_codon:yes stop_codon:yes gene_type:complete
MKQVITQHGWCLNSKMWQNLKPKFKEDNFLWQDNDRGYFNNSVNNCKWIRNNKKDFKIIICHSLGLKLVNQEILKEASHAVLINSFFSFIPKNNRRHFIIRALRKMENKLNPEEIKYLIREFIQNAFLPNDVNIELQEILKTNYQEINLKLLIDDFKKLYLEDRNTKIFSKDCKILIIKSNNDYILEESSIEDLINTLNQIQNQKPKLIELDKQGHLIVGNDIFNKIKSWLN